ncbi:MAG: S8 family peptidase [Bacteriovoracaceae bacterium]
MKFILLSLLMTLTSKAYSQMNRVILSGQNLVAAEMEVKHLGGHVIRNLKNIRATVVNIPAHAISRLKGKYAGLRVEEDVVFKIGPLKRGNKPGGGGDTPQPSQTVDWGISAIKANLAHSQYFTGLGATVCVADTGIDTDHPDLVENMVGGMNFTGNGRWIDTTDFNDGHGHGTHVSGIIAAVNNNIGAVGAAHEAKIYTVKVLDNRGSGYLSWIADGVQECINQGVDVINMSLGGNGDPNASSVMKDAIMNAANAGIKVMLAAGNEGEDIAGKTPSGYSIFHPNIYAVAAMGKNEAGEYYMASWSNYGLSTTDLTAPGVAIYSTWKDGGYNTISGTSMATPYASAVAALEVASGGLFNILFQSPVDTNIGYDVSKEGGGLIDADTTVRF